MLSKLRLSEPEISEEDLELRAEKEILKDKEYIKFSVDYTWFRFIVPQMT